MALDSCARFLAVAEHPLIPARARPVGHQLKRADRESVGAPACQDHISGGHAGSALSAFVVIPLLFLLSLRITLGWVRR